MCTTPLSSMPRPVSRAATLVGKEKEMFDNLSATQPIGRMGKPDEIASLALYLCSDEAKFVNGAAVPCDGGQNKLLLACL